MQPILKIDLQNYTVDEFQIPVEWQKEYIGGSGLAARILYESFKSGLKPLSPESPLLFLTGPLTGTAGPAVGRFVVAGRSPATGIWGEANCGGFWGPELRKCGFDGILITGKSNNPIYINIQDNDVKFHSAFDIWGMDTYSSQNEILREIGIPGYRIAVIGPAGEEMIPFSVILTDHGRVAGRTGMGAIMGSKFLKGIAVKGSKNIPIYSPNQFNALRSSVNRELVNENQAKVFRELGTAGVADYFDYLGMMPKKYYQQSKYQDALEISGAKIAETIAVGKKACHGCVIACGRVLSFKDGVKRKGPEYESLVGFGPNLLISDLERITRLAELCDLNGLDTISMSNILGLACRLYEGGLLSERDTGGLELKWGAGDVFEQLIKLTVKKRGFGQDLALGARGLAEKYGAVEEAVQVNGLEVAYHDPRGISGMAIIYATSPRGACHNQSDYYAVEIGHTEPQIGVTNYPRTAGVEKVNNIVVHQNWRTVCNSVVLCLFANVTPDTILDLLNSATGLEWDIGSLMKSGERAWNLKRVINNLCGVSSQNDQIPKAFTIPFQDAEGENKFIPDFKAMLQQYYKVRNWDKNSGFPNSTKLAELNLDWSLDDLDKYHVSKELV